MADTPTRTQVIASHAPVKLDDGSVLVRCHVHAGRIDVLFPPGLFPAAFAPAAHPVAGPKCGKGRAPLPVDPAVEAAVQTVLAMPGGFGGSQRGTRRRAEFCAKRGIDAEDFAVALKRARARRSKSHAYGHQP